MMMPGECILDDGVLLCELMAPYIQCQIQDYQIEGVAIITFMLYALPPDTKVLGNVYGIFSLDQGALQELEIRRHIVDDEVFHMLNFEEITR